jgi:glycosyltransferase involved in cell wall biosynthesis
MMLKNDINFTICDDLSQIDDTYTVAICATCFFPPDQFPSGCKVLYGPQFFVFPEDFNHPIHKYTYDPTRFFYNSLSSWVLDIHKRFAPDLTLTFVTCPFGIDMDSIKEVLPVEKRTKVMVYFKHRHPDTLNTVLNLLKEKNVEYYLFKYGSYQDKDFKEKLQDTKFVIWIGSHESQGFAFQETLASNVPILLWDVKSMYDEYNNGWVYDRYKSSGKSLAATTANVWSETCGIKFYEASELSNAYNEMNSKLDTFSPRKLIEENVSLEATFINLIKNF